MIHTLVVKTTNLEAQTCMDTGALFRYLLIYRIDSLYVCTGEAVGYNCQTVRVWRLWGSPPVLPEMDERRVALQGDL